ncbi:MAG: hypothetical protein JNJ90_17915, partial [Saprospiraceae bacterium]|nr:hypothetical protein [Saprospiraceae bacterium]
MILRRMFSPVKVARYLQMELTLTIAASAGAFVLYSRGLLSSGLPFSVAAILGSALAIFIAFRNNSAYGRWWEARTIWGGIINSSRAFARQIIANADNAAASGKVTAEQAEAYKREIVYRTIAFAHALRLHLRRQTTAEEYRHLLPADEFAALQTKQNPPNILLQTQGIRIKEGVRAEVL